MTSRRSCAAPRQDHSSTQPSLVLLSRLALSPASSQRFANQNVPTVINKCRRRHGGEMPAACTPKLLHTARAHIVTCTPMRSTRSAGSSRRGAVLLQLQEATVDPALFRRVANLEIFLA